MANATVGALRVTLGLDSGAFTDGLNAAQKHLKGVGQSMQRVGATMATVGAGITAAVTAPIIALGIQMGRAAIDAEEMQSAFKVSFGGMAKDVEAWAVTTGDAMGRSTFELQKMALGFNGLFKAGGPVSAQTRDMSKQFTVLAQDLASFHNVAEQDVFAALRSGLSGEAEPLRQFNVYLTEAAVKAEAMRMGLAKAGAELSEQAKIQARASLILKGTAEAQGDVLRTSTSTANQLRTLKSQWAELQVTLGQKLLPAFTPVVAAFNQAAQAVARLSPAAQGFVVAGAAVAAVLGPILIGVGAVVASLGALTTAFAAGGVLAGLGAFALAAAPFVAAAAAIAAAVFVFRDDLAPIVAAFKKSVVDAVGPAVTVLIANARTAFVALGPAIQALIGFVGPILAALTKHFVTTFGPHILTMLRVLVAGISSAFSLIAKALNFVTALLTGDWKGAWNAAGSFVMEIMRSIGRLAEAVFPGITGHVQRMVQGVTVWLQGKLFDVLRGVVEKVRWVSDAFFKLYDAVVGHSYVPDMVVEVGQWMSRLDAVMVNPARQATETTAQAFERVRDRAAAAMEGLLTDAERGLREYNQIAADLQNGIAQGGPNASVYRNGLARLNAGRDAEGLTNTGATYSEDPMIGKVADISAGLKSGLERAQAAFDDTAKRFGDQFAYHMEGVLRGDIKGAFNDILSDIMRGFLSGIGQSLFKGSGGGGWGNALSSIGGWFKGLPGFKTGGTFTVGGNGGIDSSLVAFRATPGEMVDIRRPGQGMDNGAYQLTVNPSPYFDVQVQKVSAPLAAQAGVGSFAASEDQRQRASRISRFRRG